MDRFNELIVTAFVTASRILNPYNIHAHYIHIITMYIASFLLIELDILLIEMRFLLVHDSSVRGQESIRAFFNDVYELFIKVSIISNTIVCYHS